MRQWAWPAVGLALAASLLLPWFTGTDDGQPLTVAGWDTEPGFTIGMLACAGVIAVAGRVGRPLVAAVAAGIAIALIVWMLQRGDRYSGDEAGVGGAVALGLAVVAFGRAIALLVRRRADT